MCVRRGWGELGQDNGTGFLAEASRTYLTSGISTPVLGEWRTRAWLAHLVLTIPKFPQLEITAGQIPSWVSAAERVFAVGGGPVLSPVEKAIYDLIG